MGCSRGVPGLLLGVPGCSGAVPGMFRGVPGVFRGVPGCSGFYRHPSNSVCFYVGKRLSLSTSAVQRVFKRNKRKF